MAQTGRPEGNGESVLTLIQNICLSRYAQPRMSGVRRKSADKSMLLQKSVHFFGQLSANPLSGGNLLDACFAETVHRSESPQQQIFPVLAYTGAIVEDTFFDPLFHEQLMVGVGKPMRLIADALKQPQSRRIHWKSQRQRPARPVNLLALLRQADDREIVQAESLQLTTCGRELAFSTIDND